jgi:hypothetical protein
MLLSWKNNNEKIRQKILQKKLFVFDFGGTLILPGRNITREMEAMIFNVLYGWGDFKIAITSGCKYEQMFRQIVIPLIAKTSRADSGTSMLDKLFLLPTSGAA